MKKYLFALVCLFAPAAASADSGMMFRPTVGVDYQYIGLNYNPTVTGIDRSQLLEDSLHGVNIHVGARLHKYFGVEAGYIWTGDGEKKNVLGVAGANTTVNVDGWTFDLLGYMPVAQKLEFIGTVGVTALNYYGKASASAVVTSTDTTEAGFRVGGGLQYWLTDHVGVRGLARYQTADFNGVVDNAVEATLGLNYQF